ncbi:MAG: hypothetical protein JWN39_2194 [Ilumatobacteraceae bacterium]|nr:hypothetical protein [Ilumatobacteraceae bacterium]
MTDPPPTAGVPAASVIVRPITSRQNAGYGVPFDIGPLPAGLVPSVSVTDVLALIGPSPQSRFFTTQADVDAAEVSVGLVVDLNEPTGSDGSTFPGYVIEGGHATCTGDGPSNPDGSYPPPFPCHALYVVNGYTGQFLTNAEVGDPADPTSTTVMPVGQARRSR